ncbi:MAG: HIG1 domain-containing protein [Betaproteobacteria bacterium]|nr:HIG1 domain-containing protein [Betaproteobacteria bacterium]MDH3436359.1 HIG1 domain-containing protein [Betaproteobacteria bacterium]
MTFMTAMVLAAAFVVALSLALGVTSMAKGGEVAHHTSGEWMVARVGLQALALALLLLSLL